ncbi:metallophosphoesterase [Pyrococcus abyssi]|uniref:Phosphoesterase n=1 Tax=Pyrococcus abyssi (strain GE5 / Orsay) TaxID=272844 RepID=Q9V0Z7_PYRAB|nr:metallophosphoesterase [Pyrococcus abyssi]CAB49554.1 Phosphoesterase, putative [Pyrococcus abyssi GE5]CCE70026.1 TPA: Phosphodiesterase [Pyrococcus abyssi GE5]
MKVGIMSDTHDNLPAIRLAVDFFNKEKVDLVIHAGDYVAPFVARELSKLNAPLRGVFGNNDGEREGLKEKLGIKDEILTLNLDDLKVIVLHGTDERIVEALAKSQLYDIVIRGHTHRHRIQEVGRTIVVNPGEVCGYLTGVKSVAILNTKEREVRIINLETEEILGIMSL